MDAYSLLPVDKRLRPMIYKPHFFKELLQKEHQIEDENPKLVSEEVALVKNISKAYNRIKNLPSRDFRDQYYRRLIEHTKLLKGLMKKLGSARI